MLFLVFQVGQDRYALDIHEVAEILPLVEIGSMPSLPPGVVGIFNYRGTPLPVVDLSLLLLKRPALRRFNTRLLIVRCRQAGGDQLLGLIAERATETIRRDPGDFADTGIGGEAMGRIGPVAMDRTGVVQRTELDQLLPASLRDVLFRNSPVPAPP